MENIIIAWFLHSFTLLNFLERLLFALILDDTLTAQKLRSSRRNLNLARIRENDDWWLRPVIGVLNCSLYFPSLLSRSTQSRYSFYSLVNFLKITKLFLEVYLILLCDTLYMVSTRVRIHSYPSSPTSGNHKSDLCFYELGFLLRCFLRHLTFTSTNVKYFWKTSILFLERMLFVFFFFFSFLLFSNVFIHSILLYLFIIFFFLYLPLCFIFIYILCY